jgi:hypothetical protein
VAKALAKVLSVAEIVTLTGTSRASVKHYHHELTASHHPLLLSDSTPTDSP